MLVPANLETHRFVVNVLPSFFTSFQVLKRLQRKDGGRPQRGGQERGDMENQEADKKFGSCPRVSNIFELRVGLVIGKKHTSFVASGLNVDHRNSWRLDEWGRIWEWLA